MIFAAFGALMFASKQLMAVLPNIHLIGMLTVTLTVVYRSKALIPIYVFVMIEGVYSGFSVWWVPYLYIWTLLWGAAMLVPKNIKDKYASFVYPIVCGAHGFLFGILYAPAEALFFKMNFMETVAWVITGAEFDIIHGIGNTVLGLAILPLSKLIRKLDKKYGG